MGNKAKADAVKDINGTAESDMERLLPSFELFDLQREGILEVMRMPGSESDTFLSSS